MKHQKISSNEEKKTYFPKKIKKKFQNNYNNNTNKYLYDYDYSQKIDLKNNINIFTNINNKKKIKLPKLLPINSTRKNNRESYSNFNNIFKSKYEFLY